MIANLSLYKRLYGESTATALQLSDLAAVKVLTHSSTSSPTYTLTNGLLSFELTDPVECSELYVVFGVNTQPSRIRIYMQAPTSGSTLDLGSCTVVQLEAPAPADDTQNEEPSND